MFSHRFMCKRHFLVCSFLASAVLSLWHFQGVLYPTWTLLSLPITWPVGASRFTISPEIDSFDLSFANYSTVQTNASEGYTDRVPAIFHHIALRHMDSTSSRATWEASRKNCIDLHPGWQEHLWTAENASDFVAEKFPSFKKTWDGYQLPIQRINALKYLVLYEYGGAVLDLDLGCQRSLGPLRRFNFVALAASQTGLSISFMMASKQNEFVGALVQNLEVYDHRWFGIPYLTALFSTGGHYASTIHALQDDRAELKILTSPRNTPTIHSLDGKVSTPIFSHPDTSAWHKCNGTLNIPFGALFWWTLPLLMFVTLGVMLVAVDRLQQTLAGWRSSRRSKMDGNLEKANCD